MHVEFQVNPTCGCKAPPLVKWDDHPRCSFPRLRKIWPKVFFFAQRRRLYQQRDMYSAALAAQAETITADLKRIQDTLPIAGQPWPTTVEPFPEVSDTTTQTNCEESNEELSIKEPSIEPSWVTTSSFD